jgi:hypothetical protein
MTQTTPLQAAATPTMSELAALQARLQVHVLQADPNDGAALADVQVSGPGLGAAQRLGIYHHAYRARLNETLRDSFAHTLRYLGDDWFDALAAAYIEAHPSQQANLRWYGQGWPDWLAQALRAETPWGPHPEVAELAALDWALRLAFDAADAPGLTLAELAAMGPDAWTAMPLKPHPSWAVLSLRHNTLSLWHALDRDEAVPQAEPLLAPMTVVVWRLDERPHFRSVDEVEAAALTQLGQGASFAALCEDLAERFPTLDTVTAAAGLLRRWVEEGVLLA